MSENNEFTFENEQYRKTYWHTCSHVLAQAVKRLHPEVKLAIGPAIDNGFYYDFDAPFTFTPEMLAELEAEGRVTAVVTQNIDGLHQMAGSKNVLELHGSIHRNRCMRCGRKFGLDAILTTDGVPRCECGGIIKPEVVLYEEELDPRTLTAAVDAISQADTLLIAGTSLAVYPAAGLIRYFEGDCLALVNLSPTPMDQKADLVIRGKIGEVLSRIQ